METSNYHLSSMHHSSLLNWLPLRAFAGEPSAAAIATLQNAMQTRKTKEPSFLLLCGAYVITRLMWLPYTYD